MTDQEPRQPEAPQPEAAEVERDIGSRALAEALQSSFRLLQLAMAGIVIYILATGVYTVKQHEVAVVLRLGKLVGGTTTRVKEPGIHFGWPYPIDEVIRIPVQRVLTVRTNRHWYRLTTEEQQAKDAGQPLPPPRPFLIPFVDGYTLTGDANIIHSRWELRYQITDPVRWALVFGEDRVKQFLTSALESAVVHVSAHFEADKALRTDVNAFREQVQTEVSRLAREQKLACDVQRVDLVEVSPPRQVKPAFDAVIEAEQDRSRLVSEAQSYASQTVAAAEGQASKTVAAAQARRTRLVRSAAADVETFRRLLPSYRANPSLVKRQLWLETVGRVLENVDEKVLVDPGKELRIEVGRDPKVARELSRREAQRAAEEKKESGGETSR